MFKINSENFLTRLFLWILLNKFHKTMDPLNKISTFIKTTILNQQLSGSKIIFLQYKLKIMLKSSVTQCTIYFAVFCLFLGSRKCVLIIFIPIVSRWDWIFLGEMRYHFKIVRYALEWHLPEMLNKLQV